MRYNVSKIDLHFPQQSVTIIFFLISLVQELKSGQRKHISGNIFSEKSDPLRRIPFEVMSIPWKCFKEAIQMFRQPQSIRFFFFSVLNILISKSLCFNLSWHSVSIWCNINKKVPSLYISISFIFLAEVLGFFLRTAEFLDCIANRTKTNLKNIHKSEL